MSRPLIAFCTTDIELVYANILCRAVRDAARAFDVNLLVLPGKALKIPYDYQYQYNVIYDYVDGASIDGIVISGGAVGNFVGPDFFATWVQRFKSIPMVSIASPIPLGPQVSSEGENPCREIVEHLIAVHKCRDIAFVAGPSLNLDAAARFEGYKRALGNAGLSFRPEYYFQGDFTTESVTSVVQTLLDERKLDIDAFVCANDEMAIAVLSQLRARGIRVPEDVAVTGFDDVLEANATEPPLSTVRQPVYQQGWEAVKKLLSLMKGQNEDDAVLPGELMLRESCGCPPNTHSEFRDRDRRADVGTVYETLSDPSAEVAHEALARPGLRPDRIEAFFSELVKARDAKAVPGDDAIRHLSNSVNPVVATAEDVRFLNHMLSTLRGVVRVISDRQGAPIERRMAIEDFYDRARIVVGEKLLHIDNHRWDEHEEVLRELRALMYTMTSTLNSPGEMFAGLAQALLRLGFTQGMLWMYENPIAHPRETIWHRPSKLLPVLSYIGDQVHPVDNTHTVEVDGLFRRAFSGQEARKELVALPLFLTEDQLGLMIVDLDLSRRAIYESMSVQISAAVKLSYLIRTRVQVETKLRDALHDLEAYNQHLSAISRTDELTGLFNRRGFLHIARQSLHIARNMGKGGLLCFADMDGLKKINDTYGHEEGDAAIKIMAEVLRNVFRSADLIARLGGDEFTVLVMDAGPDFEKILGQRIVRALEHINTESEKPWKLSFTFGAVAFASDNDKTIENLLSEADLLLYTHKRNRPVSTEAGS